MTHNPVSNAAYLKPLPLPELQDTLGRLRTVVSALASDEQLAATDRAITQFAEKPGPELQEKLSEYAAAQDAENSSWVAEHWLEGYLKERTSLPLSTNVTFQFHLDVAGEGLDRVARVIRRVAEVHLMQARGQMPQDVDARDQPLSSSQWRSFNGGLRHPQPDQDEIIRCAKGARSRRIGILNEGRMWNVPISDSSGHALSISTLRASLRKIVDAEAADGADAAQPGFADMSAMGSGLLAEPFNEMVRDRDNAATYDALRDQLFCVSLDSTHGSDTEVLRRAAFQPGVAWVYKPITYVVSTVDRFQAMHVEHSTVDGATLVTAIRRMQEARVKDGAPGSPALSQPEELTWVDVPEALAVIGAVDGADAATRPSLRIVDVPRVPEEKIPFRFSADAMSQLLMTIAQELTYGRTRGVYEAVDMREFKAGRTECLRAATPEAVAFAKAVVAASQEGQGQEEQDAPALREKLDAAVDAHRNWVKRCKTGQGIDRHLWALGFTAEETGQEMALLEDEGVALALRDFLSTTSVGSDEQVIRYAFAPSVPEGFGVCYTPGAERIEYLLSTNEATEQASAFAANLEEAGRILAEYLGTLGE